MENPWKGLASYKESDRDLFFGRDKSIRELAMLINGNLFVTLYGRTGIGKTSLLCAGVFPKLRESRYIPILVRDKVDEYFTDYIIGKIEDAVTRIEISKHKPQDSVDDKLWEYFATRHFYGEDGKEVFPVIVLDQFEENLLKPESKEHSCNLLRQLYSLIDDNKSFPEGYHDETNFRIVVSVREDDLFRLEDCIDTLDLDELKQNRYRLLQLTDSEAADIIAKPGKDCLPSDPAERDEIINSIISLVKGGDNNLNTLILSLVCSQIFERAAAQGGDTVCITKNMVSDTSGNILQEFYLKVMNNSPIWETERNYIEDMLVDSHHRRNSINEDVFKENCPSWKVLTEGSNRILQINNGKVELVHDMLARAIAEIRKKRYEKQRLAQLEQERLQKEKAERENAKKENAE